MTYPQQGYPAQTGYAPQQQYQQADVMPPQFNDGGVYGAGAGVAMPAARHLIGRTIVLVPLSVDPSAQYEGQSRPSAQADLYVVDGGPLTYGNNLKEGTPDTHTIATPCLFKGWTVSNGNVYKEIEAALRNRTLISGVIYKSTFGQKPYNIGKVTELPQQEGGGPRPDGEQRWARMIEVYQGLSSGQLRNPEPVELNPGPGAMPQYGQPGPAAAPAGYGPQWQQPAPFAQPQPQPQPQYQQAQGDGGINRQAILSTPVDSLLHSGAQRQPSDPTLSMVPPGMDPAIWTGQFTVEQRQQMLAAMGQNVPASAPPASSGTPGHPGF